MSDQGIRLLPVPSQGESRLFNLFSEAARKLNDVKIPTDSKLGKTQGFAVWMTREQFLGLGGTTEAWDAIPEQEETTLSRDSAPAQQEA